MTKAEMVTLLGYRLGDRDDMEGRIDAELPYVQEYILEAKEWLPWFLLKEDNSLATVVGTRAVALPADFLLEVEEGGLYLTRNGEIVRKLRKMDFNVALEKLSGEGEPEAYSTLGDSIQLFPIPTEVLGLAFTYYAKGDLISGTSKWYTHAGDVIAAEVGRILAEKHLKDHNTAAGFSADATKAWARLYNKHIAWEEINTVRVMGGNT